jgi:hypothetical protein
MIEVSLAYLSYGVAFMVVVLLRLLVAIVFVGCLGILLHHIAVIVSWMALRPLYSLTKYTTAFPQYNAMPQAEIGNKKTQVIHSDDPDTLHCPVCHQKSLFVDNYSDLHTCANCGVNWQYD